jgi:hypothetical protein
MGDGTAPVSRRYLVTIMRLRGLSAGMLLASRWGGGLFAMTLP